MKALAVKKFRTKPELMTLPDPQPGEGEVLVRMAAAGLNPFDWKAVDGALEKMVEHSFPLVIGSDGAGVVEKVGAGVDSFKPGDRVFGQFMNVNKGRGSFAELAVTAADKLAALPPSVSFTTAAALPTAGATAQQAVAAFNLDGHETLLINGATGGVGQAAVQFAAATGARVVATGTPDIAAYLTDLGAEDIIDYGAHSPIEVLGHRREMVDGVLDLVSVSTEQTNAALAIIRSGGSLVSTNGAIDADETSKRGITGINFSNKINTEALTGLAEAAATNTLKVRIESEVPLASSPGAFVAAQGGHARGKTVITIAKS